MGIASATGRRRYRVPKGRRVIIWAKPEKVEDRARTVSRRLSKSSSPSSSSAPMAASTADLVGIAHLPTHLKLQRGATRLARSHYACSTAGRRIDRESLRLSERMLTYLTVAQFSEKSYGYLGSGRICYRIGSRITRDDLAPGNLDIIASIFS